MADGWLYGWKEVANHLGCSVRTAKKFHYEYSMPIGHEGERIAVLKWKIDEWRTRFQKNCKPIRKTFHH